MTEALSGIFVVVIITTLVYAGGAAVSAGAQRRWTRTALAGLSVLMIVAGLGLLAVEFAADETVSMLGIGVLSAGAVLGAVVSVEGRRAIARALPIETRSTRAWAGLVLLLWLVILRLATFYGTESDTEFGQISVGAAAIQTLAFLGIAFGLIGVLVRRGWRDSIRRLGYDRFSIQSTSIAAGLVIPMAIVSALTVVLVDTLAPGTTERLSDTVTEITGGETSLGYGLALGISAAVGEETLFRGAIQPKYGLIFTSLVFAVLHVQYDLLLVVASLFPVGLILGLERKYLGTFACVVTHALYNTLAVVLG